ncbi:hypothetical protein PV379_00505 [Streptomyces caniscabiei]|uniref:hypothetical protein n=1 Tax=Streptomyces caniscabiei TaxID=2746961 RepID=UPI0029A64E0F|nr:hypothetical protein [Streptomyces caniscabiei]MDX2775837.1 hypothetical protein [Streptomyces caniscabiei]
MDILLIGRARRPSDAVLDRVDSNLQLPISVLGSAAEMNGEWVGVSIHAVFMSIRTMTPASRREATELAIHALYDPGHWWDIYSCAADPIIEVFHAAIQAGLITIVRGYAFPRQALATLLDRA